MHADDMHMPTHLNHAYLSIGQSYKSIIDQSVSLRVSRLSVHYVPLGLLVRQGDGRDLVWMDMCVC